MAIGKSSSCFENLASIRTDKRADGNALTEPLTIRSSNCTAIGLCGGSHGAFSNRLGISGGASVRHPVSVQSKGSCRASTRLECAFPMSSVSARLAEMSYRTERSCDPVSGGSLQTPESHISEGRSATSKARKTDRVGSLFASTIRLRCWGLSCEHSDHLSHGSPTLQDIIPSSSTRQVDLNLRRQIVEHSHDGTVVQFAIAVCFPD